MKERTHNQYYESMPHTDGAGVKLRRLFHREDTFDMDPFLMLDLFDSKNPDDYIAGFPFHPHRGIQTFTYLISGEIQHKDSMGNEGTIFGGEYQWMSAGSGIFHEEMPKASDHMLGFQLWINLPKSEKMSKPLYVNGDVNNIPVVQDGEVVIHVLSGAYKEAEKLDLPGSFPIDILDFEVPPNTEIKIPVKEEYSAFVVTLQGEAMMGETVIPPKTGVTFVDGDEIVLRTREEPARIISFAGPALHEAIAWRGPVVMNTQDELSVAFEELRDGTFVKQNIEESK